MNIKICNAVMLLLALTFLSCTEEISDEVQNSETKSSTSTTVDYTTKSIRLVHGHDEQLSYIMHKSGNYESDCELTAPSAGFDADDYDYASTNYAIDCVLDVEELDLAEHGVNIELQVDDQLCEYVRYIPYRFLQFMPGKTSRTIYKVDCDAACAAVNSPIEGLCGNTYKTLDLDSNAAPFTDPVSDTTKDLCTYDYSTLYGSSSSDYTYPNCDEGEYNTVTIQVAGTGTSAATYNCVEAVDNAGTRTYTVGESETTECAGKFNNCIEGPAKDTITNLDKWGETYDNSSLGEFSQSWTYTGTFGSSQYGSNMRYANYSRICSDNATNKTSDNVFSTITFSGYHLENMREYGSTTNSKQTYNNMTNAKDYQTHDTADYAALGLPDGVTTYSTMYAENMWRGGSGAFTYPYYAFYCMDKAFDVKAQIRLFVREWDREFTKTNTYLNEESDVIIASEGDRLMDARYELQPNVGGGINDEWNDWKDLDDRFEIETDSPKDNSPNYFYWENNTCTVSEYEFNHTYRNVDGDGATGTDADPDDLEDAVFSLGFPGVNL